MAGRRSATSTARHKGATAVRQADRRSATSIVRHDGAIAMRQVFFWETPEVAGYFTGGPCGVGNLIAIPHTRPIRRKFFFLRSP